MIRYCEVCGVELSENEDSVCSNCDCAVMEEFGMEDF